MLSDRNMHSVCKSQEKKKELSALKAHMVWTLAGLQVQARSSKTAICLSLVHFQLRAPENTSRQLLFVKLSRLDDVRKLFQDQLYVIAGVIRKRSNAAT